jgi:putative ABC transport system permease protein
MTKSLIKNTFREIKNTKARFISIMAIIALGVGFFAGIKATVPSMYNLARTYTDEQELMDYRLVSTVGFDEDDIKAVKNTDGVTSVMPIQARSRQRVIKSATKSDLQNRRAIQILQPNLKPLNTRWSVLCSHLFT